MQGFWRRRSTGGSGGGGHATYQLVLVALGVLVILSWFSLSDLLRGALQSPGERAAQAFFDNFHGSPAVERISSEVDSKVDLLSQSNPKGEHEDSSTSSGNVHKRGGFVFVSDTSGSKTSAAHCSLSTMNSKSWEGAMCSFKSLCYLPSEDAFVFYKAVPDIAPPTTAVNLGRGTSFLPQVIESPLPVPRYEANGDETWILTEMRGDEGNKVDDFVHDQLFAWWMVAQHVPWSNLRTTIKPLIVNGSAQLTEQMKLWYIAMPFSSLTSGDELKAYEHPVCFPRSVAGTGSMSDHCLAPDHDFHELKRPSMGVGVEAIPCTTGRGPLFYKIREEMISSLTGKTLQELPRWDKGNAQTVLLAEDRGRNDFVNLESKLKNGFPGLVVKRVCTSCMPPRDQLDLALSVSVLVSRSTGPQTLIVHFLRKGAGIVMVAENKSKKYANFGLWNNLAYVRSRWAQDDAQAIEAIRSELEKAQEFM